MIQTTARLNSTEWTAVCFYCLMQHLKNSFFKMSYNQKLINKKVHTWTNEPELDLRLMQGFKGRLHINRLHMHNHSVQTLIQCTKHPVSFSNKPL